MFYQMSGVEHGNFLPLFVSRYLVDKEIFEKFVNLSHELGACHYITMLLKSFVRYVTPSIAK